MDFAADVWLRQLQYCRKFRTFSEVCKENVGKLVRRESQNGLKKLVVAICKAYDEDDKCFDLGVNIASPDYGTGLNSLITSIRWNDFMWDWSASMWAIFLLETIYSLQIEIKTLQKIIVCVTYKIQKGVEKEYFQFIDDLNKSAKAILKRPFFAKYRQQYMYEIVFERDGGIQYDVAYRFDSEICSDLQLCVFKNYCLKFHSDWINKWKIFENLKDRTKFPAHDYDEGLMIVDYENNNKVYTKPFKYIQHRLFESLNETERRDKENIKFVNCAAKFMLNIVLSKVDATSKEYPKDCTAQRRNFLYWNYWVPVTMRRIYFKYAAKCGQELLLDFLRKNCDVCGAIEIFPDTRIEKNKKYVKKMYHCRCCFLFVCSRKCQKIAWNRKPWIHRLQCPKKRVKVV